MEILGTPPPTAKLTRRILALLAINPGRSVPVSAMVRELWDSAPLPEKWSGSIQTYVLKVRQGLDVAYPDRVPPARDILATRPGGYVLEVSPMDVDAFRFFRFVDQATRDYRDGRLREAEDTLRAAFSLWNGPLMVDVDPGPLLTIWADSVREKRREAVSLRFQIDLCQGRHRDVVGALRAEWRADPAFEPTAALLMTALYRSDRQRDALDVFRDTRNALREGYGLEPGSRLRLLQQQILRGDPSLELEAK
jgi:DNA-binding SARP family transcriptional activator